MTQTDAYPSLAALGKNAAAVAARHIDRAFRHMLRGPKTVAEPRFVRLITGEPHPFGNMAVVSDPADAEGTRTAIAPLRHCGAPAAAMFPGPVAPAVAEELTRAGFGPHGALPAMVVEIDALQPTGLPAGYSFRRVGGPDSNAWVEAFAAGYELPRGVAAAFSPDVAGATPAVDAAIQFFAIYKGERMVCTSVVFLADGVAGIYCVATIPEERGQGLGAHATAEPLRLVRNLGYRVGVLQASPAGHPLYKRLGFVDVGEVPLFVRVPG